MGANRRNRRRRRIMYAAWMRHLEGMNRIRAGVPKRVGAWLMELFMLDDIAHAVRQFTRKRSLFGI